MRGVGYIAVWSAVMVIGLTSAVFAGEAIQATIIDNEGTRHEVSDLKYYNHDTFFFSRGKERVKHKFKEIASIDFQGMGETENRPLQVTLRDGSQIQGTVFVGSGNAGQYVYGASQIVFTGKTDLGPFTIQLKDIKKVMFRYDVHETSKEGQSAAPSDTLWATIVARNGTRYEVFGLDPPHRGMFEILQGEETRRLTFQEIRRIEFMGDEAVQEDEVPVLVTLRDGTTLAGTTLVGSLRGTTNIYDRGDIMLSAKTTLGPFAVSLRSVKDIVFHAWKSGPGQEESGGTPAEVEPAADVDTSAVEAE